MKISDLLRLIAVIVVTLALAAEFIMASHIDLFARFWLAPEHWAVNVEWQIIGVQGFFILAWYLYLELINAPLDPEDATRILDQCFPFEQKPATQCCTLPDDTLARDTVIFGAPTPAERERLIAALRARRHDKPIILTGPCHEADAKPLITQCCYCKKFRIGADWYLITDPKSLESAFRISHGSCPVCHERALAEVDTCVPPPAIETNSSPQSH